MLLVRPSASIPNAEAAPPWQVGIIGGAAVHGANLHRHGLALLIKLVRYGAVRYCGSPVTVGSGGGGGNECPGRSPSMWLELLGVISHYNHSLALQQRRATFCD